MNNALGRLGERSIVSASFSINTVYILFLNKLLFGNNDCRLDTLVIGTYYKAVLKSLLSLIGAHRCHDLACKSLYIWPSIDVVSNT